MQFQHSFTVPVSIDAAWQILLDAPRIVPCLPGASLDFAEQDTFRGRVKVKLGPVNLTYRGEARIVARDDDTHRAVIEASGEESRGASTAGATVEVVLREAGGLTSASLTTELRVTGEPAQFGRGMLFDVGDKLFNQFVNCLAQTANAAAGEAAAALDPPTETGRALSTAAESEIDPVEVLEEVGASLVKRVLPAALLLAVLAGLAALASARRPAVSRLR